MKGFGIGVETNIGEEQRWNVNSARTAWKRAGAVPGANTRVLHGLGISLCQPLMRYNLIKKDLSSRGRARSGTRKSLFDTTGKAFPAADRASSVHRKSGSRPSENFFQAHHAKETVIWNNKNGISSGQTPRCHFCFTAFRLSKFFTSAKACPSMLSNCGGMAERQRTVRRLTCIRVRAPSPPQLSHAPRLL